MSQTAHPMAELPESTNRKPYPGYHLQRPLQWFATEKTNTWQGCDLCRRII